MQQSLYNRAISDQCKLLRCLSHSRVEAPQRFQRPTMSAATAFVGSFLGISVRTVPDCTSALSIKDSDFREKVDPAHFGPLHFPSGGQGLCCTDQVVNALSPLSLCLSDADGLWASKREHPVQGTNGDGDLRRTTPVRPRAQTVPNHSFKATDGGLHQSPACTRSASASPCACTAMLRRWRSRWVGVVSAILTQHCR
jgi:hypothetical protein